MYCSKCGNNNNENNEYCVKCGNKLNIETNNSNLLLNKKTFLILSILSLIIPFGVYVSDIILQTPSIYGSEFDFITAVLLFIVVAVISVPSLVLMILNIISSSKKQNTKGLVIAELVFVCINLLMVIWLGFPSQESLPTKIGFILGLIISLAMATGYITKLIRKKC